MNRKTKTQLLELLAQASEEEQAFVATLTDAERAAVGTLEYWSAKDILAHVGEWKMRMAQALAAAARREASPRYDDIDRLNAEIFETHRNLPWADVLNLLRQGHGEVIEHIQALSEDDMLDTEPPLGREGRSLWDRIVGNGYIHPLTHLAQFYFQRGDTAYAMQLQEAMAETLLPLDDSARWRGGTIYNLACAYALAGQKEKAIANLGEALRLHPDLIEWSKQDPDFASIREDGAYLALYA